MNCGCGGWLIATVAEIDGKQRVVVKCTKCKEVTPIRRDQPIVTESILPKVAMGRTW